MHIAFDIIVVGAGGGPDETNLSSYLLKPHDAAWKDGIVALEAGSVYGAICKLLAKDPFLFSYSDHAAKVTFTAHEVYSFVRSILITHAHLDHISGLVLASGSMTGPRKRIHAMNQTLQDIESVFSGRVWPNLATWDEDNVEVPLLYSPLPIADHYTSIYSSLSVKTMAVNYGHNASGFYTSAVFFVRHDTLGREFLFFGDVEPDSLSEMPRNIDVWREAAPKIPYTLRALFIECSWPSGRTNDTLFGHLNPEHLLDELTNLALEVIQREGNPSTKALARNDVTGALSGVIIYVIHCKDILDQSLPMRQIIVPQVQALMDKKGLGARIVAVEQGMHIAI